MGAVPHSDDSVEESGAEGLSLAWRCVQGGAIVSCGETKSVQLVSIQVEDFGRAGWVSTAELVPGSDHVPVPAVKSSDHVVPPAPLTRSNNNLYPTYCC